MRHALALLIGLAAILAVAAMSALFIYVCNLVHPLGFTVMCFVVCFLGACWLAGMAILEQWGRW